MSDVFLYEIQHEDVGRPDLISNKVYGSVKYFSVVLNYNNMYDPFVDLKIGRYLLLPKNPNQYLK